MFVIPPAPPSRTGDNAGNASVKYVSTRGHAPVLDFEGAALAGLARDGGLYLPEAWPQFSEDELDGLAALPYAQAAQAVMSRLAAGSPAAGDLPSLLRDAYSRFDHAAVAPLVQIGASHWLLELFHGPTLAFKDIALQFLGPLMDNALRRRGQRATILGATSGDTGAAAIEAFKGRENTDIFILFPHGRVSDVQRLQMTTSGEDNVHAIAVRGSFDDCQAIVKTLFSDLEFRDRWRLLAVNSINWARIMAQIVYYFTAALSLGAPRRRVSFIVPTGNFGDIFAGYAAARMGLPMGRLVIAANVNDILVRTLADGTYRPAEAVATESPSMDIQVSSNFERLLFEASGRDASRVCELMNSLRDTGAFTLSGGELTAVRSRFSAWRAGESEVAAAAARLYRETGYIADPHTAVGLSAAWKELNARGAAGPMVTLSTAHPAKFPQFARAAAGVEPPVPERLKAALSAPERFAVLDSDPKAVAGYVAAHSRA
jgi:threonine synthase